MSADRAERAPRTGVIRARRDHGRIMNQRALLAQARIELLLTLRRSESLLVTLGIPIGILVFFAKVNTISDLKDPVQFLVPGILALAVMSTAMVSLGIATGYERHYGVLKRLGATPLSRSGLLAAKTLNVLAIELIARLQLKTRHAVGVHGHQMETVRRDLQREFLHRAAVPAGE